jgi:hypothetical protein
MSENGLNTKLHAHPLVMYSTMWCLGMNSNAGTAIFLLLWHGYHRHMKIMKDNSTLSSMLALSEPKR